ncbi:MAG: rRNA maturation RNase YbeY [Deltaproteobacteria bacterium]|nr:rRNA maturation RNase YbeY [Deltaproteobacteria bacterium]
MEAKARAVLAALGSRNAELSVCIVSDREIAGLNKRYLKRTGPTNVIAFPMREGAFRDLNAQLLGDVVISADTAASEAEACKMSLEERLDQLLVHGIVHLFGFDHEKTCNQADAMKFIEAVLLDIISKIER